MVSICFKTYPDMALTNDGGRLTQLKPDLRIKEVQGTRIFPFFLKKGCTECRVVV